METATRRRALRTWGPFSHKAFPSALHDERTAALLGLALGVSFSVCFLTGLVSHLLQHPQAWFAWPSRPVGLYRITQGTHVLTGIASIPLLLAKLWVVYPKLFEWPPVKGPGHALERLTLLPLIGGSLFLLVTGVINVAYWYTPMPFFFPAAHFWVAWLTIGALLFHIGAKLPVTRRAVFARRPAAVAPDRDQPEDSALPPGPAEPDESRPARDGVFTRRGFLVTVGGASGVLAVTAAGQTVPFLRRFAVLAPRRPGIGPQGVPVNRTAAAAGVGPAAMDPNWRLVVAGRGVDVPLSWTLAELRALPQRSAGLPIACVEGWSASAAWRGVALSTLLGRAGAPPGAAVRMESLEQNSIYATSVVDGDHLDDPDTLIALELNGEPLHPDHGFPCRLIAPNRPGVLQTKWLTRIVVL